MEIKHSWDFDKQETIYTIRFKDEEIINPSRELTEFYKFITELPHQYKEGKKLE